jgi:DNA replication protein DnaC
MNIAVPRGVRVMSAEEISKMEENRKRIEFRGRVDACHRESNVPTRYKAACLNDASRVPKDALRRYDQAMQLLGGLFRTPGLIALYGDPGTGKTYMGCAMINEFCDQARIARYVKASDYVRDLRNTWKGGEENEGGYCRRFGNYALLVLDEMTVRRDTPEEDRTLLQIIDKRYENERSTILISNHATEEEVMNRLDGRIVSRMRDSGGIFHCDWQDLRGRMD